MTEVEIQFERLIDKIRKDGEGQHGASMVDVEKIITLAWCFIRLEAAMNMVVEIMEDAEEALDKGLITP